MYDYKSDEDQRPMTWLGGHPVYAAYFVVLVFTVSMIATALLRGFNAAGFLGWMPFSAALVLKGEAWRVLTYGLANAPSLNFVLDMAVIAWFGREVEKIFGRRKFLALFGAVYLVTPLLFTLLGLWIPTGLLAGETGAFAVFVAFATLYPDVAVFFGALAKWVAVVLLGIFSLTAFADHDAMGAASLWATSAVAFVFVRVEQGRLALPSLRLFPRRPKAAPARAAIEAGRDPAKGPSMAEVDALLDKIAQSGFASLTPKERARLDSARDELAARGSRR
jgi:membrane associated rhomboid family serine protease